MRGRNQNRPPSTKGSWGVAKLADELKPTVSSGIRRAGPYRVDLDSFVVLLVCRCYYVFRAASI